MFPNLGVLGDLGGDFLRSSVGSDTQLRLSRSRLGVTGSGKEVPGCHGMTYEKTARSGTRGAQDRARKKRIWTSRLPSGCRGRFLICEKKLVASAQRHTEPRRRGTTPTFGEQGEVCPEYVAPVSRPACRSGLTRFGTHLAVLPSSACDCSRARSTAGKAGAQELMPLARREPRKTRAEL